MADDFDICLAFTLGQEGGFACLAGDPGGATNHGVTLATWAQWAKKPCTPDDIKALTVADVTPLYRSMFWEPLRCDSLGAPLALCVFDFAVNSGNHAAKILQGMVNAAPDGAIGDGTIKALQAYVASHGIVATIKVYQALRGSYYRSLSTFGRFGNGWLDRTAAAQVAALGILAS